jgi:5-methylcytosine-specific restriction endonuclease McrA
MNKLPIPAVDDDAILGALSANHILCSYPHLAAKADVLTAAYLNYRLAQGRADQLAAVELPDILIDALHAHFKSPPRALDFIDDERRGRGHKSCPMCGSLHSGTVDHVIPRTAFPAFTVFSKNLVRACKCNSSKNDLIAGQLNGARVLHPYFDECLNERLLRARIRNHGPAPEIDLEVLMDPNAPEFPAVRFHIDRIVLRTGLLSYLRHMWVELCRKPSNLIPLLSRAILDLGQLEVALSDQLSRVDEVRESKNNWDSIFVAGLLENESKSWLLQRVTAPTYIAGMPLEWDNCDIGYVPISVR